MTTDTDTTEGNSGFTISSGESTFTGDNLIHGNKTTVTTGSTLDMSTLFALLHKDNELPQETKKEIEETAMTVNSSSDSEEAVKAFGKLISLSGKIGLKWILGHFKKF